jgi:hypothetical protein
MIGESLYPSALNQFSVRDGCLIMEGVPLIRLVKHAGLVDTGVSRSSSPKSRFMPFSVL